MNISSASIEDANELVSLINSAYRGESSLKGWTTEAHMLGGIRTDEQDMLRLLNNPHATILKYCNEENEIIGCVFMEKRGNRLYLGMLTVDPDLQAKGIGKQFLSAAEAYAKKNECSSIYMTVISTRYELIAWYERHGYAKTGETRPFDPQQHIGIQKQPFEFIVMQKTLK
jgi:ribosomal protein S18 acetylase RimI-like enzyme